MNIENRHVCIGINEELAIVVETPNPS